jgi:hypothetical protein
VRAANRTLRTINRCNEPLEIELVKIWPTICACLFVWRNLIGIARRLGPAAPRALASPRGHRRRAKGTRTASSAARA